MIYGILNTLKIIEQTNCINIVYLQNIFTNHIFDIYEKAGFSIK